jgi:hypothetical protein
MLLDKANMFSQDGGDTPTATGSTASGNVIDLGIARDIGGAVTDDLGLLIQVITAFTSGGSATLQVQYQGAPDNGSGAPGSWSIWEQSDAIPVANLVQGYKFLQGRPVSPPAGSEFRFVRLNYVIGTATMTAGAIEAAFVPRLQHNPTYARGYVA